MIDSRGRAGFDDINIFGLTLAIYKKSLGKVTPRPTKMEPSAESEYTSKGD